MKFFFQDVDIEHFEVGVEIHNENGKSERHHAYLRYVFEQPPAEHPELDDEGLFQMEIKSCYDVARSSQVFPALLIFGTV